MTYKNLLLAILLMPLSLLGNSEQIAQLTNDLKEQILKASEYGKKIARQEELIEDMIYKASVIWQDILSTLNEDEKKVFNDEIDVFLNRLNQIFKGERTFNNFLKQELFENKKNDFGLGKIKSAQMRIIIERIIWKNMFEEYEQILSEMVAIDQKIENLKKQNNGGSSHA